MTHNDEGDLKIASNGKKVKPEDKLSPNEKYWRDDLVKHFAGSFVAFLVVCGFFATPPDPTPPDPAPSIPAYRMTGRCLTMIIAGSAFIAWGVGHGIWIRETQFDDDSYEYDTVVDKKQAKLGFFALGSTAYLIIASRACADLYDSNNIHDAVSVVATILAVVGMSAIFIYPNLDRESVSATMTQVMTRFSHVFDRIRRRIGWRMVLLP